MPILGDAGEIDLKAGVGERRYAGEYQVTSPPVIAGDLVIVGSAVSDTMRIDAPSGVVCAFDIQTGELKWSWDLAPPSGPARSDLISDAGCALGTPNVWAVMSVDQQRDLLFVPTGNPSPDYYGGMRDGHDFYGSSVVALRASTGEAPISIPVKYGTPNLGGPMITGGGLVFIGAAMDNYIRALDIDTGTELWKRRLPAGGQATPMTYRLTPDQPQMVVIAAGGHGRMGSKLGDYVIAYSLCSPITSVALWLLETLLAFALVLSLRRFLFPPAVSDRVGKNWFARWTHRATNLVCGVTALAALARCYPD